MRNISGELVLVQNLKFITSCLKSQ